MSTPKKDYITAAMARWAAGLTFEQLSPEAVHQAKRFLLDSLGCAVGGYLQHDVRIALEVLEEIAGRGPATVIGSGRRIDPVSAALANALMVRVMDYNDIYWKQDPSHPSDIIPAAIACGERAEADGRELIVGIVLGHEFEQRLCEAAFPGIRERGWHHATLTAFVSPLVAGRMLRLSPEQLQHAVGISASRHATLGAVTAGKLTMMKNTVDPMATQSGVLAALLAERGYTGPEHVIDGKEGLAHCFGPEWKLEVLTDGLGESYRITSCGMKAYPTEALTHTPISAVLQIVREHDLKPEQVAKIHDPRIRQQLRKVEVVADPEIEKVFPALQRVVVTIRTTSGAEHTMQLDYPQGDPRNPLSDEEIEAKFEALAEGVLTPSHQRKVKSAVWDLEQHDSITEVMRLLKATAQSE
jgi:2-methylcitrate dehydratase